MKKYRVFGTAVVTVSVVVDVPEDRLEEAKENDELGLLLYELAEEEFGGINSYAGNGGLDKLVGVEGGTETIQCDDAPEFDDWMEEN